jgi:hypothetical protein
MKEVVRRIRAAVKSKALENILEAGIIDLHREDQDTFPR